MARKRSEFLGALGKLFEVFKAFVDDVIAGGGGDEDVARILTDKELRRQMVALVLKGKQALSVAGQAVANTFKVVMDYTQSLADMIKAGNYNWVNSDITEKNFPTPKVPPGLATKVNLILELVHFNRRISSDDAITELKKMGLRPATLPELLAFGSTYPEKQREFPIAALGSVWQRWDGIRPVPVLWGDSNRRHLYLGWFGDDWRENYRFLAVRES